MLATALAASTITPAAAEPATWTISYPARGIGHAPERKSLRRLHGPLEGGHAGLDCGLRPTDGVGVYLGGVEPHLQPAESDRDLGDGRVHAMRWRIIPIYMGRQAPCTYRPCNAG